MRMQIYRFALLFLMLLLSQTAAKTQDYSLMDMEVRQGGDVLALPFAGGLIAPQFNKVDVNLDGIDDIVIFDRDGEMFIPILVDESGQKTFDPSYRSIFPAVRSWAFFRDFDQDGIMDLFCSPINVGIPGIEVYKGSIVDGRLHYGIVTFPQRDFDILYVPIGNSVSQIYVSPVDLPDIRDVDGDLDLDVLAFEPAGNTVYFYKNLSVENGFGLDSLIFELADNCYGGMIESGFSQTVKLSPEPGTCANFFASDDITSDTRHAGSTVTSFDLGKDGLHELILGDISYNGLVCLENGGTPDLTHFVAQVPRYPETQDSVDIELFLGAFIQTEGDKKYLIAAPNDRYSSQTTDHIWRYELQEEGSVATSGRLLTKNYLVEEMIHTGQNSVPLFRDVNADGLLDLIVGTRGTSIDGIQINPHLKLYKNVGTSDIPIFQLEDEDYLNMAQFQTTSRFFAPAMGDLDGDGDDDMVIGDDRGRLYYLENTAGVGVADRYATPVYDPWAINVSAFATPQIFDANGDGLGDLIIGEQNFNNDQGVRASLNYFENIGSVGAPQFDPDESAAPNDPSYGGIDIKQSGFVSNYSAPSIFRTPTDVRMILGSASGKMSMYQIDTLDHTQDLEALDWPEGELLKEGENTYVSLADIDNDQYLEIAIGSRRGGLAIYNTDISAKVTTSTIDIAAKSDALIDITSVEDEVHISWLSADLMDKHVTIVDAAGRVVHSSQSQDHLTINVSAWATGMYYVRAFSGVRRSTSSFVVVR